MESGSGDLINVGRNQSGYAVIALKKKKYAVGQQIRNGQQETLVMLGGSPPDGPVGGQVPG